MKIKLPIQIHNKFDIEVKDIVTGKITRGKAENIVLKHLFQSTYWYRYGSSSQKYVGDAIVVGRGNGIPDENRTTLFDAIGRLNASDVEWVRNPAPIVSYGTKKAVITSSQYVGEIITEVGVGCQDSGNTVYTHALIKDSEGNPLSLGPKTETQEITIYSTVYFAPNLEPGIYLLNYGLYAAGTLYRKFTWFSEWGPTTYINGEINMPNSGTIPATKFIKAPVNGLFITEIGRAETGTANTKIKNFWFGSNTPERTLFSVALEELAENNSSIWSGHEFDRLQIGIGDGNKTVFTLQWDDAWLEKPKKVYVDGMEVQSGFAFNEGNITFDIAPVDGAIVTADYWVKYIPKDADHVLDIQWSIQFGEGSPL